MRRSTAVRESCPRSCLPRQPALYSGHLSHHPCGERSSTIGVAPTKAIHRKLIMQTLEKVEGMSLEALEAGLGNAWPFETFPQYLDTLEKRGSAINIAALFGHTPLRMYVMGEDSTERAATVRSKMLATSSLDASARLRV